MSVALEALNKEVQPETTPMRSSGPSPIRALDEDKMPTAICVYQRVLSRKPMNAEAHMDQGLARVGEPCA